MSLRHQQQTQGVSPSSGGSTIVSSQTIASSAPSSKSNTAPSQRGSLYSTGSSTNRSSSATRGVNGNNSRSNCASSAASLKLPLSPDATLHYYKELLTPYEQREVLDCPEVYFAGAVGVVKVGTPQRPTGADESAPTDSNTKEEDKGVFNHGYDDARGDYYLTYHDHIGYRYELISLLGKGSFGQVVKCYDHKAKCHVALKIIRNKKRFEKQGMVEVKVLDRLRKEDSSNQYNIVHMQDHFYFRGHLCITFELLGVNLYEWLKGGGFRGVHLGVIKKFAVQIVQCMDLLDRNRIVHCDMKPENVLLKETSFLQPNRSDLNGGSYGGASWPADFDSEADCYGIKVIDFGSSCFESEKVYTYVQSRFYRSPEVILGISYNMTIDMWSLGCILAELFTGYPLFPGENEQEQLACIMELKGLPPDSMIERGSRRKLFFDSAGAPRILPNSRGKKRRPNGKSLNTVIRTSDLGFLDFINKCLEWDPQLRMTPEEALRHEWLKPSVPASYPFPTRPITTSSNSALRSDSANGRASASTSSATASKMLVNGRSSGSNSGYLLASGRRQHTTVPAGFTEPDAIGVGITSTTAHLTRSKTLPRHTLASSSTTNSSNPTSSFYGGNANHHYGAHHANLPNVSASVSTGGSSYPLPSSSSGPSSAAMTLGGSYSASSSQNRTVAGGMAMSQTSPRQQ
ncbi:Dual specificity tyrosine-phosphorylation-regulated kinase, partial [Irineochytrium annulatum]